MSFSKRIKTSRFALSCIFLTGYTAYTAYALYYYLTYRSTLGIVILCLIGAALAMSAVITFTSYRINLKGAKRPALFRFLKMATYATQLLATAITIFLVLSTVRNTNVFSLIVSAISVPFLVWSLFVNIFVEFFERKVFPGGGKKVYEEQSARDEEGEPTDIRAVISNVDGTARLKETLRRKKNKHV